MERKDIVHRLSITPERPGVYMMKDAADSVIYVGKAGSLRNRVRTYFGTPFNLNPKIRKMVSRVADFDYIVTDSEAEAIILECTLIKKYRPTYNARLKDDKSYPYIKIDLAEDFPEVYVTRLVRQDGARYFGPFATAHSTRKDLGRPQEAVPLPLLHQDHHREGPAALPWSITSTAAWALASGRPPKTSTTRSSSR